MEVQTFKSGDMETKTLQYFEEYLKSEINLLCRDKGYIYPDSSYRNGRIDAYKDILRNIQSVEKRRAVGVTLLVFTQVDNEIHVLLNKRGYSLKGKWNLISGYLEYDEDAREACVRELREETGMILDKEEVRLVEVSTSPEEYKQHVILRYAAYIKEPQKGLKPYDKREVLDIRWVKLSDIQNYDIAWNQKKFIIECLM